ncbi:TetR/AcrR family transcriptional regulator [Nonomuraea sp. NPDC050536]|uniref:TetR/AcrR family transcriptional regulator n=1 Tax=Nonomuraea sp. NPDC050536 TaxID=3364366 RepID=UPI0037C73557
MGDRRQELIEAAFRCLAVKGFEGLRLREVAREVGIDHSTLHHHFPTKNDLIAAVVQYTTRQLHAPGTTLGDYLDMLAVAMREQPELFVVLREIDLRSLRDPEIRATVEQVEEGWRGALAMRVAPEHAALVIAVAKGLTLIPDDPAVVLAHLRELIEGA